MQTWPIICLSILLVIVTSCGSPTVLPNPNQVVIESGSGPLTISVETVSNQTAYEKGLSGRGGLEDNAGMLFVFNHEQFLDFWMKDMLFPLDIVFISKGLKVVDVRTMPVCIEQPCPVFSSKKPAQYALEMSAGYAKDHKIKTGNMVILGDEQPKNK